MNQRIHSGIFLTSVSHRKHTQETHDSKVILGDLQPERVEWLLRYLYTDGELEN